ncbi:MAG: sigma-70 family RNA polymerase sigma factor [Verrucomicrobia bacterium]|nr:sigma-70 family RNA polymerase sigma factor [Verrucomicrobiota bacterium]
MMTDAELLLRYTQDHSESAFTELVQRRVNLVYSAALRETQNDGSLAEDVTQAVFTELARQASSLSRHPALAGWLYTSVRHVAANLRRSQERRLRREQETHLMNKLIPSESSETDWRELRPVIDDAMHELAESDRATIVLRFFEDQSLKEVGQALGLNENAARMRVDRAMEKLRASLAKRGITSTATGLAAALVAGAVISAPTGLAATVAGAALTGAAAAASTTFTVLQIMTTTQLKVGAITALVVAGVTVPIWQQARLNHLAAENNRLLAQTAELPALREEVERLRPLKVDHAELERLRGLQSEVLQLRAQVGNARRAEAEVAKLKAQMSRPKPGQPGANDAEGRTNQFDGVIGDMMKGLMEQQFLGQLTRMKAKLNLTPEQEQSIRGILLKQAEQGVQVAQRAFTGKLTNEDIEGSYQSDSNPKDEINALLSPEQQAAYKEFKKEEAASVARLAANAELLQIQGTLGLSQEQQDQVFNILYERSLGQGLDNAEVSSPKSTDPLARIQQQFQQTLKSMEKVLSPSQFESYRQFQESQLKMFKNFAPMSESGAGGAAPRAN